MMKRSHAVIGAAAGVAVAHATGASMLAGGIVAALAGLLPDVDHPHAAVGRLLPRWWHRLTPGHRGPTHSLVWCLGLAVAAYVANSAVDGEPAGPLLALAVLAGSLSHVLADGLTVAAVVAVPAPPQRLPGRPGLPYPELGRGPGRRWGGRRGRLVGGRLRGFPRSRPAQYRSSSGLTRGG
jgi:inner membrane protein